MKSLKLAARCAWSAVPAALALTLALAGPAAQADEAAIRKSLSERLPNAPRIDEVSKTGMGNLFEVRIGSDILYTDADGNFLIQGDLIDLKNRKNVTEERRGKLLAIDFDALPLKDAFTIVRGDGKRRLAVFEDPNCGYCKRFERELLKVDNITVYMFLYPVLGKDSVEKSKALWCAKDRAKAWQDYMLRNVSVKPAAASCDADAVARNMEWGQQRRITGTPTLIFANGQRVPGAIDAQEVEKYLAAR